LPDLALAAETPANKAIEAIVSKPQRIIFRSRAT